MLLLSVTGASQKTVLTACLCLTALLFAGCGGEPTDPGENGGSETAAVTSVEVTPSSGDLESLEATLQLTATARDPDGNELQGRTFEWNSTDADVATVDADGAVTAVANGTARIEATTGGVTGTATVTVRQLPVLVDVGPSTATLDSLGDTTDFAVKSADANRHPVEDVTYAWSSSAEGVATVNDSGVATARGAGETDIIATADPGGAADTAVLTVDPSDTSSGDQASIVLSRTTAGFSATEGGDSPGALTIDVTNGGSGDLTGLGVAVTYPTGEAFGWLSASLGSATAPTSLTLEATTAGLAAGSHTATVSVTSDEADNSPVQITVTFDVATPSSYSLTVTSADPNMGSVSRTPSQTSYDAGSAASVEAEPFTGHEFTGWTGDLTATENPLSVTMDRDLSLTATFRINPPALSGPSTTLSPFTLTWTMQWPCYNSFGGSCLATSHDGYQLEESTTSPSDGFTRILTSATRSSPFTTQLTRSPGTYYYRVRAVGESWVSPYSDVLTVEVTSGEATLPAAPSGLTASASGSVISLRWTDNSTSEDGFELHGSTSSGFTASVDTFFVAPNVTSAELTGETNTTYYFRVRAFNGSGSSAWSNTVAATTSDDLTVYATADNTVVASSADPSLQTQVFSNALAVGCDFAIGDAFSDYVCRSAVLEFADLRERIADATITSATLKLYPEVLPADYQTTYVVNAVAEPWDSNTLTWENQPQVFTGVMNEQSPPTSVTLPLEFDVTAIVQNWADGSWPDHGLLVWDSALNRGFPTLSVVRSTYFEHLEGYSTPGRRPQLEIVIQ